MVGRHLLDSLALASRLAGPRVLDVGSGPGLPGIPLAIARPDLQFVLLDAASRKTRFLVQATGVLGLENASVVRSRVQQYRPPVKFDTLVARAVASSRDMLDACRHLIAPGGRLLAMKGRYPAEVRPARLVAGGRGRVLFRARRSGRTAPVGAAAA